MDSNFRFLVVRPSNRHGRRDCCLENGSGSVDYFETRPLFDVNELFGSDGICCGIDGTKGIHLSKAKPEAEVISIEVARRVNGRVRHERQFPVGGRLEGVLTSAAESAGLADKPTHAGDCRGGARRAAELAREAAAAGEVDSRAKPFIVSGGDSAAQGGDLAEIVPVVRRAHRR